MGGSDAVFPKEGRDVLGGCLQAQPNKVTKVIILPRRERAADLHGTWFFSVPVQPPVAFRVSRQRGHPATLARSAVVCHSCFFPGRHAHPGGADPDPRQVSALVDLDRKSVV